MGRVVITGIGPISSLGCGLDMFNEGLKEFEPNIFENELYPGLETSTIEDYDVNEYLSAKKNYLDPQSAYSFGAFASGIEDSGLDIDSIDKSRCALVWATAFGGVQTMDRYLLDLHKKGPRFAKPILFPHTYGNTAISLLSIEFGLSGYHQCFTSGWTAGTDALVNAYHQVADGNSDVAFVGAADALSLPMLNSYKQQNKLATTLDAWQLYDSSHDGFIAAEGAGMLVFETLERAQKRGAKIYAEVSSPGLGRAQPVDGQYDYASIYSSFSREAETVYVSPANGLNQFDKDIAASLKPSEISYVLSLKSLFGETFSASGVLHAAAVATSIQAGFELPVSNPDDLQAVENKTIEDAIIHSCDEYGQSSAIRISKF